MRSTVLCLAFAGLATGAMAQDFSLSIVGPTLVAEGAVFTLDIIGNSSFGTHLAGGAFSLVTNSDIIDNITWTPAGWSAFNEDNGYAGNGNYNQVVFGQLLLPFPGLDTPGVGSELGGAIGSFQITLAENSGDCAIDFALVAGSPFTLEAINIATFESMQDIDGTLTLNGLFIPGIPAPSSIALLGLGGLAVGRRRRA